MISEGKITIGLGKTVSISSNRSQSVAALLIGREVGEALSLLPLVFSLCAHAHDQAARLAMGRKVQGANALLVLAENAREHLLRILLGWQGTAKMPAPPVMALVPDMIKALKANTRMQVADRLDSYLETYVHGMSAARFLRSDFVDWLGDTQTRAAQYLRLVIARGWQGLGAVETDFLPQMPARELAARLGEAGFCLAPDWRGVTRETGPLARQFRAPMVAAVLKEHGAGLLARLLARLVDLARIPALMRAEQMPARAGAGASNAGAPNAGASNVETARGRLIHWARLEGPVIADYRILAPTEWNFHPQGVAAQALRGLDADQARALIEAIDPCVDFEFGVA